MKIFGIEKIRNVYKDLKSKRKKSACVTARRGHSRARMFIQ